MKFSDISKQNWQLLIMICGMIIASQSAAIVLRYFARQSGTNFFKPLDENHLLYQNGLLKSPDDTISVAKMQTLLQIAENHKSHHKKIILNMYQYRFATVSLLLIFSILTAVLIFIIGQSGWFTSSLTIRILFVTSAAFTAFYSYSARTYNQEYVIDRNTENYICFDNIQKSIFYSSIEHNHPDSTYALHLDTMFHDIQQNMIKCNNIYFDLEDVKVNPTDLQTSFGNLTPGK